MLSKYKMTNSAKVDKLVHDSDTTQLIDADVLTQGDGVEKADVVILHNVFEFFCNQSDNQKSLKGLKKLICKKGTRIVARPSIQQSIKDAGVWIECEK